MEKAKEVVDSYRSRLARREMTKNRDELKKSIIVAIRVTALSRSRGSQLSSSHWPLHKGQQDLRNVPFAHS